MKGQTQAVTAVLITGIIVTSVTSAYVWGTPLLEKREAQSNLDNLESQVVDVKDSAVETARGGQGNSDRVSIELDEGTVELNETGNYIEIRTRSETAPYPIGSWRLLEGDNRRGLSIGSGVYGISGDDQPGVVAARRESSSNSFIRYRIEFRNLRESVPSGLRLRQVDLRSEGADESNGDTDIVLSNLGTETDTGSEAVEIEGGDDLDRVRTVIGVEMR